MRVGIVDEFSLILHNWILSFIQYGEGAVVLHLPDCYDDKSDKETSHELSISTNQSQNISPPLSLVQLPPSHGSYRSYPTPTQPKYFILKGRKLLGSAPLKRGPPDATDQSPSSPFPMWRPQPCYSTALGFLGYGAQWTLSGPG